MARAARQDLFSDVCLTRVACSCHLQTVQANAFVELKLLYQRRVPSKTPCLPVGPARS